MLSSRPANVGPEAQEDGNVAKELSVGASGIATRVVQDNDLASKLAADAGDSFPATLSTARLVALIELAASRALKPILEKGEVSVGTSLSVEHLQATPQGSSLRARARFVGMDGEAYRFEVAVEDEGGEIARATHVRRVVEGAKWLEDARHRAG
jgi:fluoroacetyl-CoA thioesterase